MDDILLIYKSKNKNQKRRSLGLNCLDAHHKGTNAANPCSV